MALNPAFWRGRAVLVTGHTGFKGGWLCWWLKQLGAEVTGLALDPPGAPSLYEGTALAQAIDSRRGDVRDPAAVAAAFEQRRPEIVFHLAAQALVRRSYREPVETFATNVLGTVNCLEAARACASVRALVVVTSDKCYRERGPGAAHAESDPLGGRDPYAASKACAEIATGAYRESFFTPRARGALVASARAGNVIGGGDWAEDRLVPDLMRAFAGGRAAAIRNPGATRPWQHVLDALHGYLILGERLHAGERDAAAAWNFGPGGESVRAVSWVADGLVRRWGGAAAWTHAREESVAEAEELRLDSARARERLGWRPQLALEEALDWVVEWHKADLPGADARDLTLRQIERFQARCTG
jgi:CDP-glucose 4,6-dehydratase